jgi:hypothetical protein
MHEVKRIDFGRFVCCDICDTNFTDDSRSGGYLFTGKAVGPCCAEPFLKTVIQHKEVHMIRGYCPPDMSFADWIRQMNGPEGNILTIWSS